MYYIELLRLNDFAFGRDELVVLRLDVRKQLFIIADVP